MQVYAMKLGLRIFSTGHEVSSGHIGEVSSPWYHPFQIRCWGLWMFIPQLWYTLW